MHLPIGSALFLASLLGGVVASAEDLAPTTIASMDTLSWTEVAPGVWSGQIGAREKLTFRELAGAPPNVPALRAVGAAKFPFEGEAHGETAGGRTSVRIPLSVHEQVYGLGLQFNGINRRGQVWHLRTDHYGDVPGRTHAPVPFYVSSAGYGVLFNTAALDFGVSRYRESQRRRATAHSRSQYRWSVAGSPDFGCGRSEHSGRGHGGTCVRGADGAGCGTALQTCTSAVGRCRPDGG